MDQIKIGLDFGTHQTKICIQKTVYSGHLTKVMVNRTMSFSSSLTCKAITHISFPRLYKSMTMIHCPMAMLTLQEKRPNQILLKKSHWYWKIRLMYLIWPTGYIANIAPTRIHVRIYKYWRKCFKYACVI